LLNIVYLVIGFILGLCGSLLVELLKRQLDKKEQRDNAKKLLQALSQEIENGINRCKWLIKLVEERKVSFSRIYTGLWDSVKSIITKNIEDAETLILLHKIYYHFDLINFNMNQQRFGTGAAYAKDYIKEIEENHVSLKRKISLIR